MDIDTLEGRQDFFLLQLYTDRINRKTTGKGWSDGDFNLSLELCCNQEPRLDKHVILNELFDKEYVSLGEFGNGTPPRLTKLGSEFIMQGGFTEEKRKKEIELKKDEKLENDLIAAKRNNRWFYAVCLFAIVSATGNVVSILDKTMHKEDSKQIIAQPQYDTIYIKEIVIDTAYIVVGNK